ncbi:hypothetical protein [Tritonibacter mobilis]|uniref:hypothetical protein n=1 Tax=Tritonibacter mobilis TaxID=379347 RepID=UPI00398FEE64
MAQKYQIKCVKNHTAPDGNEVSHYEVQVVFDVDGEKLVHRNHDRSFKTHAEAQAWIEKQEGG